MLDIPSLQETSRCLRPEYSKGLGTVLRALTWSVKLAGTSGDRLVQPHCSEQGQLGKAAQDHLRLGFWKSPVMETQQPVPAFDHPHINYGGFFLVFKWNL